MIGSVEQEPIKYYIGHILGLKKFLKSEKCLGKKAKLIDEEFDK